MGRKIPLVSFLCGVLSRKKTPPPDQVDAAVRPDHDNSPFSTTGGGDAATIPNDAAAQPPFAAGGGESSGGQLTDAADQSPTTTTDQQQHQPLPPPPGIHHHRSNSTASCHRHHQRSNSAASKLMSSMSMRVLGGGGCGGGGGGGGGIGRQAKTRNKDKKFSHEDSIWKKTIILGEKCRVPDEDEDSILYDEKGRKISTYHPKTHSGTLSYARQSSSTDQQDSSRN